jgi:hypothetical protein
MDSRSSDRLPEIPANLDNLLKELELLSRDVKLDTEPKPKYTGSALVIKGK